MSDKVLEIIKKEELRQKDKIRLIPSENYVSEAVKQAVGSVLMNKYSEGQIGKRYYQGNSNIDEIESIVKERALKLFKLDPKEWSVNVQAVSGSIANLAVYSALLNPGDFILSMFLPDGGHLSHGWRMIKENRPVSFTSKIYRSEFYFVDPQTDTLD